MRSPTIDRREAEEIILMRRKILIRVMEYLVSQRLLASQNEDWHLFNDLTDAMYLIDKIQFPILGVIEAEYKQEVRKKRVRDGRLEYRD